MEFEKEYLPLKKVIDGKQTNEVVGNIKLVKNGDRFSFFVFSENKANFKTVFVLDGGIVIQKTEMAPEIVLNYKINKPGFCVVINDANNLPLCAAGKYINKEAEDEEIEKLIDFYMQTNNDMTHKNLKSVLFAPLFRTRKLRYYKHIEKNLKSVLINYPKELVLENLFAPSSWAKAEIDGKMIVVGVVYKNDVPIKIGVGFPSLKKEKEEINKKCGKLKFYPVSPKSNFGYYLNFKDANTGKDI